MFIPRRFFTSGVGFIPLHNNQECLDCMTNVAKVKRVQGHTFLYVTTGIIQVIRNKIHLDLISLRNKESNGKNSYRIDQTF